jgi:hypothetical protein
LAAAFASCAISPRPEQEAEGAAALGEIADAGGRKYLEPILDDPDPEVRKNARWAMQRIISMQGALGS